MAQQSGIGELSAADEEEDTSNDLLAADVHVPISWEEDEDGTTTATFQADLLPEPIGRVGRFDILGRLALGGMAEIYLARESGEGNASRLLVVKFLRSSLGDNEQLEQMFELEARVAMRLSHPNICHVYEVGKARGRHFIAMQFINGVTIRDLIKTAETSNKPLPIPIAIKVAAQVAEALDFAHRARDGSGKPLGVVHRDVSPHNIMLSYDGVVKLLDFGVAKVQESMTQSGTVKGKFAYMSPEQAQCKPGVDGRSDIFSLGIVLYEAITGTRAYQGGSEYDSLRAIVEDPVPSPRKANPEVSEELDAIVQRALAKDPADRFQTAEAMQVALEELLAKGGHVVNAARISRMLHDLYGKQTRRSPKLDRSEEASGSFVAPLSIPAPAAAPAAPQKSRLWWAWAVAAATVIAAASFAAWSFGSAEEPATIEQAVVEQTPEPLTVPEEEESEAAEGPEPEAPPADVVAETEPEPETPQIATTADRATARERRQQQRNSMSANRPVSMDGAGSMVASMRRGRFVTTPF